MPQLPLSHNPQSYFNGYISMTRNVIIMSTVGLTTFTMGKQFKKYQQPIVLFGLFIITLSIIYSLKASYDFNKYLKYLNKHDELEKPYTFLINDWYYWIIITTIYSGILIIIVLFILFRRIVKLI